MKGVDTNVLLRFLIEDDEGQTARVHRFLAASRNSNEPVFVSCIVLCETVWVLRTAHGLKRPEILNRIESLLDTDIATQSGPRLPLHFDL